MARTPRMISAPGLRSRQGRGHVQQQQQHPADRKQRGQRDDPETRQAGAASAGGSRDADAERQHQWHRDRPGGDRTGVPGEPECGPQVRIAGGMQAQAEHRHQRGVDQRLEAPPVEKAQRPDDRRQADACAHHQDQRPGPVVQHGVQVRRPLDGHVLPRRLQCADRRLGESDANAEQQGDDQDQRQGRLARQGVADHGTEWHQAQLESFHEEHQSDDDRKQPARDGPRVVDHLPQDEHLEQDQVRGQRHHGPELLHEAPRHVGPEQLEHLAPRDRRDHRADVGDATGFVADGFRIQAPERDSVRRRRDGALIFRVTVRLVHQLLRGAVGGVDASYVIRPLFDSAGRPVACISL
jgi:hypothetical protein